MTETLTPDICVIGAGSGGLTVAAAAAAFGVSVVLVEKGRMGGDCLNYGCVPSKAMLAAAKRMRAVATAGAFGIAVPDGAAADPRKVNDHVRAVIAAIAPNDSEERFTALGVRVIRAAARFVDRRTVEAAGLTIRARRFVIATGSTPVVPPIPGMATVDYFTNETIFENRRRLAHLIIIGAGPIGLEMAQAHQRLGTRVTVIEAATALANEDPELAAVVVEALRAEGVDIRERATVERVERRGRSGVRVHLAGDAPAAIEGSALMVATGRRANVADLGLDQARVRFEATGVKVNAALRTSNRRVYAIGDVVGPPQFTHLAGYHAAQVVRSILFRQNARPDLSIVPRATFTDPELAQVGLTEGQARQSHRELRILRWPFHENDRAQAERRTAGMVKLVTDARGRILGAGIVGAEAGELINLWALAVARKMTVRDIVGYVAPYPTLAEAGRRAAIGFYAPLPRRPLVRWLVNFLRKFG
ncbi:MAG: mercuric reductase [Alphaproteobacteria bacterium]|nr:MAG: mercuric reductase [Alphaproteobacteria bacterium]